MEFIQHFRDAQRIADTVSDWSDASFDWQKAYVAAVFAAVSYEEIPQFELKKSKRAKLVPCDRYQAHISRWESQGGRAAVKDLLGEEIIRIEVITRSRVLVTISLLRKVIFVSLRGTTVSFADLKADLDFRKVRYQLGFGEYARLHRGFFDAVLDCFDEVVDRLHAIDSERKFPVYITGHSLGGAMAAIFHARLYNLVDDFRHHHVRFRHTRPATSCYSFGRPRYGDTGAKTLLAQPYHTFNELDAIPTLPPKLLGFEDSANERCLNAIPTVVPILSKGDFALRSRKGIATVLGLSDHRMERYIGRTRATFP